jgi:hypothetical protein
MTTDSSFIAPPVRSERIRADIAGLLAQLPDTADLGEADIEFVAGRLEEAHEVLVRALESVEKG